MSTDHVNAPVNIVGAGPTGALLAILLKRRGIEVQLFDSRRDPRGRASDSGRSINVALAARGINALRHVGVFNDIAPTLVPMRGRCVHVPDGRTSLQPYGQQPDEVIHSVSRHRLNQLLLDVATARYDIPVHFGHRLESADALRGVAQLRRLDDRQLLDIAMRPLIGTDGAGSALRRALVGQQLIQVSEADLDHGYKELSLPAAADGTHALLREALHIWPRGRHMLIALPNDDGTFTATLFMPKQGNVSFSSLQEPADIERFLQDNFADVCPLMPHRVQEFIAHPVGFIGTVRTAPWHHGGAALLMGDAAHAIVPFHGQGMNCCFEDCVVLDALLDGDADWSRLFATFSAARKPNADAIADMSLENYDEMRERVADPKFQLQQMLALELERRFPAHFIPRYSMVMFHHEIPYALAEQRGRIQSELLAELTRHAESLEQVDFAQAARSIAQRLTPLRPVRA